MQFCYLCTALFYSKKDWIKYYQSYLENLQPRCGMLHFNTFWWRPALARSAWEMKIETLMNG